MLIDKHLVHCVSEARVARARAINALLHSGWKAISSLVRSAGQFLTWGDIDHTRDSSV